MAQNRNVWSENGELSSEILLGISEILALQLPSGNGKHLFSQQKIKKIFILFSFFISLRQNNCREVDQKVLRLQPKRLQTIFVVVCQLSHEKAPR
jgi:hypothetical protein